MPSSLLRRVFALRSHPAVFAAALLGVCAAAYAFWIPQLGFYWDDFPMNWIAATMGGEGLGRYFSTNRPFWGLFYRLTTPLLGSAPLPWHVFALLLRWGSGMAFWWLVRLTWPRQRVFADWAALLWVVYPGFSQQAIAFLYSHFFIILNLYLLSLCFTLLAVRHPRYFWPFSLAAWAASAANLLSMEYFFLLDLLRPVWVWLVLGDSPVGRRADGFEKHRLLKTAQIWLPYLVIFFGAMAWRSLGVGFQTYQPALIDRLRADPLSALLNLAGRALADIWLATAGAWARAFTLPAGAEFSGRFWLLYGLAAVGAGLLALVSLLTAQGPAGRARAWLWQPLAVGALALMVAGGPFWLTDLKIYLSFSHDRFTLPFMIGASLVSAALLAALPLPRWGPAVMVALAVGAAAGMQFQQGYLYRHDWNLVNTFFQQMLWRIPDLQPGTALLTNELPMTHYTDNSLSAPLNWVYDPDGGPQRAAQRMDYILYYPSLRAETESWIARLQKDRPIRRDYLAAQFEGNSSQVVILYFQPPACLRVLDPDLDAVNWMTPEELRAVLPLATTQSILPAARPGQPAPRLPEQIFNDESAPNWCYYFEKADLARQVGDWETVTRLGDLALAGSDYPNDPAERLPFVEGYAHTGNWQRALEVSRASGAVSPVMKPVLCRLWERIGRSTPVSPEQQAALALARAENECAH